MTPIPPTAPAIDVAPGYLVRPPIWTATMITQGMAIKGGQHRDAQQEPACITNSRGGEAARRQVDDGDHGVLIAQPDGLPKAVRDSCYRQLSPLVSDRN